MARGMARVRFGFTSRVFAALRIDMRLFSETRNVLEYLPKDISMCAQMRGQQRSNSLTVFREWPFFTGGDPETRRQPMRTARNCGEVESYGHVYQFSFYIEIMSAMVPIVIEDYSLEI